MKPREWFRVQNLAADADSADFYIFDVIGKSWWDDDAVGQAKFLAEIRALPESVKTIRLHISSPGGNPFDAVTMANTLREESRVRGRRIEVSIEGLAASAATVVAMAGDVIRMADNALFMIHEASGFAFGPKSEMVKAAEMLESIDRTIVATYRWQSKLDEAEIAALMSATTWMDAAAAKAKGFITDVVAGMPVAARFAPSALAQLGTIPDAYRPAVEALVTKPRADETDPVTPNDDGNCPDGYEKGDDGFCYLLPEAVARVRATTKPQPADPAAVVRACKEAGFPELADDLLTLPMADVKARLEKVTADKAAADARATEIRAICKIGKVPSIADFLIQSGAPIAAIREHVTRVSGLKDNQEIDGHLKPDQHTKGGTAIDTAAIYADRNKRGTQNGGARS